jgi:CHRD domain
MLRSALLGCAIAFGVVSTAPAATLYFQAKMKGSYEVPPTKSEGAGTAKATLDTATKSFSYQVMFDKLSGPATAAHFHGPAAPGKNAGVVVPIDGQNPTSPASGSATLTDPQIKDLEAGKWYVNVHTAANPGGEIRGQVLRGKATASAKPMKGSTKPMKSSTMPASGGTTPAPAGATSAPGSTAMPAPAGTTPATGSTTTPAPSGTAPAQK